MFVSTDPAQMRGIWYAIAALLVLTVYRIVTLFFSPLPFQVDEAQYVGWSHDLAAGYYSKPPMIAWVIASGVGLCSFAGAGVSSLEPCARLLQPVAFFVTSLFAGAVAWQLFAQARVAGWAMLLLASIPLAGFYSLAATTDAWLLLFWSMALFFLVAAVQSPTRPLAFWVACGVAVGLGLLSKYSMAAFVLSSFVWLLWTGRLRQSGPWVAVGVAFLVFLPNIIWNVVNGFPTFSHHVDIAQAGQVGSAPFSIARSLESLGIFSLSQFATFGPISFGILLWLTVSILRRSKNLAPQGVSLLLVTTWGILSLALFQAFSSRAHANWAAPAYVSGSILVAWYLVERWSALKAHSLGRLAGLGLVLSVAIGVVASIAIAELPKLLFTQAPHGGKPVRGLEKIRGWDQAAIWVKQKVPGTGWVVMAEDRRLQAAIAAYAYPQVPHVYAWNPDRRLESHYQWFWDVTRHTFPPGQQYLFLAVTKPGAPIPQGFSTIRLLDTPELDVLRIGADGERLRAYVVSR